MALNIKNREVEQLVEEIAQLTGESKTVAIRRALLERRARLRQRVTPQEQRDRLESFLAREVWTRVPPEQAGRPPTGEERGRILGYGPEGI